MLFIKTLACRLWDHLRPEPAYESGQTLDSHVLIMVPLAIPVALGLVLILLTR